MDCNVCTSCINEYYMLKASVWEQVHNSYNGMLCIDCVEKRIGRPLVREDFADVPLNKPDYFKKSLTLVARLNND